MEPIFLGDVWEEVDPRHLRRLTVIGFEAVGDRVILANAHGRTTKARRDRFNGKRGGYRLVERPGASHV